MRRWGLILAGACLILFGGLALFRVGGFRTGDPRPRSRRLDSRWKLRHLQCQPRHWRYCVMPR